MDGRAERLKAYTIGVDVFERAEDFDPHTDTIVRVQAGKLRQRLDLYYAKEGREDPLRIHIPKGSYAPVFEIAEPPDPVANANRQQASPVAGGSSAPAIAVLPLDDLSPAGDQSHFADGITEEIIGALTRFRDVRVASRKSTFRYKDKHEDPRRLGQSLSVDYVLEGSVRRAGQSVRITTQLIETRDGMHLMSEHYDHMLTPENLFEIQDDIAARVAAEIADPHGVLSRAGGRRNRIADTSNMDAYDTVLASYAYLRQPTPDAHAENRDRLEGAVRLDPDYSSAWAMLAIVYLDEARGHLNPRTDSPPLDRALQASNKAVELDPLNSDAFWALALVRFHRKEFDEFRTAADKTLQLNPNHPDHLADCGICHAFSGDWDKGMKLVERAAELCVDPPGWYFMAMALDLYRQRKYDEAETAARKGASSAWHWGPLIQIMILGQLGRTEEATPLVLAVREGMPQFVSRARDECRFWNISEDLIDHYVEGWRKGGLAIA